MNTVKKYVGTAAAVFLALHLVHLLFSDDAHPGDQWFWIGKFTAMAVAGIAIYWAFRKPTRQHSIDNNQDQKEN